MKKILKKFIREIIIGGLLTLNIFQGLGYQSIKVEVVGIKVELEKSVAENKRLNEELLVANAELQHTQELYAVARNGIETLLRANHESTQALRVGSPASK